MQDALAHCTALHSTLTLLVRLTGIPEKFILITGTKASTTSYNDFHDGKESIIRPIAVEMTYC